MELMDKFSNQSTIELMDKFLDKLTKKDLKQNRRTLDPATSREVGPTT